MTQRPIRRNFTDCSASPTHGERRQKIALETPDEEGIPNRIVTSEARQQGTLVSKQKQAKLVLTTALGRR